MMRCALFLGLLWLAGCGSGPQGPEQMKEAMNLSSYGHDSYSLGDYHVAVAQEPRDRRPAGRGAGSA
jgi:hypothetical protein